MQSILSTTVFLAFIALCCANPVIVTADDDTPKVDPYRLNQDFKPELYKIVLTLENDFATKKTFTGVVDIDVNCFNADATELQMHKSVNMTKFTIKLNGNSIIPMYNKTTEVLTIPVTCDPNKTLKLHFEYTGVLFDDMYGFYLSKVNENEYIATTQFQPTYARRAFPCFDEPSFKSKFQITLTVPDNYQALSNQPIQKEIGTTFTFKQTPLMSTYLVAFVVSEFKETKVVDDTPNTFPMLIWTPTSLIENAIYAQSISRKIIKNIGNMLMPINGDTTLGFENMKIDHLDQVAIPDFAAGAMENWGLVTYRESALLWNKNESKMKDKERVASVIAHEFAHNWFGNWVTLTWWDNTWLNEGFATYFESHALVGIEGMEDFESAKQFVLEDIHSVMETDGNNDALPLTSAASTVSEIQAKFGTITYSKGGSIIRMMEKMVGKEKFFMALNAYIAELKGSNTTPEKLFNKFEDIEDVKFEQIMKTWIEESGYPVLDAKLQDGKVVVTQRPFSYNKKTERDIKWYVPITWSTINIPTEISTSPVTETTATSPTTDTTITESTTETSTTESTTETSTTESTTETSTTESTTETSTTESTTATSTTESTTETSTTESTTETSTTESTTETSTTESTTETSTTESTTETSTTESTTETSTTEDNNFLMIRRFKRNTAFATTPEYLKPTDKNKELITLKDHHAIIINPENAGYYRVSYDDDLWIRIIEVLKVNHNLIDDITRAQLINDAMSLARTGDLKYNLLMEFLGYLKEEKSYYPWKAALTGFSYLRKRLVGDNLRDQITSTMTSLMEKFYIANQNFSIPDGALPINVYTKILALEWGCELNGEDCVQEAQDLFNEHIVNPETKDTASLDANLRSTVYCAGLRHSASEEDVDKTNWHKLWENYENAEVVNEKVTILTALGCTKNPELLREYLNMSIISDSGIRKQDASMVLKAVLAGNPEGVDVSLNFLTEKFKDIANYYGSMGALSSVITQVADRITTSDQFSKFETFVTENDLLEANNVAKNALNTAKANIEWATEYKQELNQYYNKGDGNNSGASGIIATSMVGLLLVALIAKFV